ISFSGNIAGGSERVDTDKYEKEDARDFALWKLVGPDEEPGWDAPFGRGRPGWHIECSAMSMKYLGETFDLHAGGMDLQFPHHENEIAQSEGATGKQFARYWIHSEFLKIDDVTMSKSKGNFFTFRDLREQGYSSLALRYLLLSVPTRKQLNFTFEGLQGAESTIERLRNFRSLVSSAKTEEGSNEAVANSITKALADFEAAMDDDFNTAASLAAIHDLVREVNTVLAGEGLLSKDREAVLEALEQFDSVLGIFGKMDTDSLDGDIELLVQEREEARRQRNFARSDEIRDLLADQGIVLEDTKDGVRWKRK
ncbi:MAG: DALR domain-containing protein, partial [Pyrinomonadaceae bacterium]